MQNSDTIGINNNSRNMELKEYWEIFKKNAKLFWGVVILVMLLNGAYFILRPTSYDVSLALNIARKGSSETSEYQYDEFYRLQADEKFAETLVEWLKNPRIATDIYLKSGKSVNEFSLRKLAKIFKAEKLSSQMVLVSFSVKEKSDGEKISQALSEVISEELRMLNEDRNKNGWFKVVAQNPVIVENKINFWLIFAFPLLAGMFLGFWAVMIRHYLK